MSQIFLVAGLGNPGLEYERTRHNAGFLTVTKLAARWKVNWSEESRFKSQLARHQVGDKRVILCKPQTYMNLSGEAVGALVDFYRIPPENLLVVVDDADLPLGSLRLRAEGSSGGHHGLESIEKRLSSRNFGRQKIGIGRSAGSARNIAGFVLGRMDPDELAVMEQVLDRSCKQIEKWLESGMNRAMNEFNGLVKEAPDQTKT